MPIDTVIPKHASLCILLSLFLTLEVWHLGHQTKDAKVVNDQMRETYSLRTKLGLRPHVTPQALLQAHNRL